MRVRKACCPQVYWRKGVMTSPVLCALSVPSCGRRLASPSLAVNSWREGSAPEEQPCAWHDPAWTQCPPL